MKPKAYSYVRFSSDKQKLGDSLNRQTRLSQKYVDKHDLELDTTLSMLDLGKSAYSGKNVSDGALGAFLKAIKDGKILRGSYLLVESLDRLSRQDVLTALTMFISILNNDIIIVTLLDGVKYDKESISRNPHQLIISLTIMQRAFEESETKSKRLKHSWHTKRKNAQNKPMTSRCPAWLEYNKESCSFDEISERVTLLKKFFKWSLEGYGTTSIQGKLNGEKTPTWGKSKGWHTSYLQKIYNNRSVLGEFQPHKTVDGKRVMVGEPIQNYYPQVIDEKMFYLVQNARNNRRHKGGRRGKNFRNLFTNLLKCGYCGSSMRFVNKGSGPKGGTYLNCSNAIRNMGCYKNGWQYKSFEISALTYIENLDLNTLFNETDKNSQVSELNKQLIISEEKLEEVKIISNNLIEAIETGVDLPNIKERSAEISNNIYYYKLESKRLKRKINKLNNEKNKSSINQDKIIKLISESSNELSEYKLHDIRRNLNQKMKSLIDVIFLYNVGSPFTKKMYQTQMEYLKENKPENYNELKAYFKKKFSDSINPEERLFNVFFKNETRQTVKPSFKNPENFDFIKSCTGDFFTTNSN